jgi:acyl-CoA thioesterase
MLDEKIRALLGNDRVAEYYGMRVESLGDGRAVVVLEIEDLHRNGIGIVHGGVIFALADVAFALAANSRGQAISANSTINFCSAAKDGMLRARAEEISLSRKLGTYQVVVEDEGGKTVALLQGLGYRKAE